MLDIEFLTQVQLHVAGEHSSDMKNCIIEIYLQEFRLTLKAGNCKNKVNYLTYTITYKCTKDNNKTCINCCIFILQYQL